MVTLEGLKYVLFAEKGVNFSASDDDGRKQVVELKTEIFMFNQLADNTVDLTCCS